MNSTTGSTRKKFAPLPSYLVRRRTTYIHFQHFIYSHNNNTLFGCSSIDRSFHTFISTSIYNFVVAQIKKKEKKNTETIF